MISCNTQNTLYMACMVLCHYLDLVKGSVYKQQMLVYSVYKQQILHLLCMGYQSRHDYVPFNDFQSYSKHFVFKLRELVAI